MEENEASKNKPTLKNQNLTKVERKASQRQKNSLFTNDTEITWYSYE